MFGWLDVFSFSLCQNMALWVAGAATGPLVATLATGLGSTFLTATGSAQHMPQQTMGGAAIAAIGNVVAAQQSQTQLQQLPQQQTEAQQQTGALLQVQQQQQLQQPQLQPLPQQYQFVQG